MKRLITSIVAILISLLTFAQQAERFNFRGMHVDMRAEVMTMDALYKLADRSAELGLNVILMEWEATFPFQQNATLCNKDAYTQEEVRDFIAYCASKGIEVIPLQNCFGHVEYIMRHERYAGIRETGIDFFHSQVCPCVQDKPEEIFRSIFSEIAAMHPSKYIHIGCDETRLLGSCRGCKMFIEKHSKSELFVYYVNRMCKVVRELGKTPIIWHDIIAQYPEAADKLPKDLIIMDWNYGWDPALFGDTNRLKEAGLEIWGASALRSNPDNIYTHDWEKHFNNLTTYMPYLDKIGATSIVNTSWSTSGIYSFLLDNSDSREEIEIYPLRQCYPLSAYDILIAAFADATRGDHEFNMDTFIPEYCAERFGFNSEECAAMLSYFHLKQPTLYYREFTTENLQASLDQALCIKQQIKNLKPKKHKDEFAHLTLMLDFRINYLEFKIIEREYESEAGNLDNFKSLRARLAPVVKEGQSLRKRFCRLNKDYLKDPLAVVGKQCYIYKAESILNLISK